ncbi:BRO family protein [Paenibacillus sp. FSL E2-0178]|uniref:BRO-N domain-containing protein n=1 Tax=Paenibacillus sp. FSL E2-0178 TaxID=2921361 RepID=UPI003158B8AF
MKNSANVKINIKNNQIQNPLTKALANIFSNEEYNVRAILVDNEPWFVLSDVCKVLGIGNPSDVKGRLDDDDYSIETLQTAGGMQRMITINENGLYDVILESKKPVAKTFRKWITKEVIPSIRKSGSYNAQTNEYLSMSEEDRIIAYFTKVKADKELLRLAEQNKLTQ